MTSLASVGAASMIAVRLTAEQSSEAAFRLAADPLRPQFHLLPAGNWMNDPNGPIYFNGLYHMFFQLNPHGSLWGDMNWAHSVSRDMIHWRRTFQLPFHRHLVVRMRRGALRGRPSLSANAYISCAQEWSTACQPRQHFATANTIISNLNVLRGQTTLS